MTTAPGTPECKVQSSIIPGGDVSGVGVSGKTPGEIDAGEALTVNFGGNVYLESFDIAAFYNGPEYDDPREQGFVTVWFADSAQVTYWFWADPPAHSDSSLITNLGGTITNMSPMTGDNAGWFHFENPFGNRKISQLLFTAADTPSATNNSDYALKSLVFTSGDEDVVVPEPGTFAMLGLGLLAVGLMKRRIPS
ncbi:MAG: PEP-CTERM sorting domain-containing protein [Bryobacterales bacterium]|nr:PEP-CTERM sorting domain-containing protein [Bryobacterales bacterium]